MLVVSQNTLRSKLEMQRHFLHPNSDGRRGCPENFFGEPSEIPEVGGPAGEGALVGGHQARQKTGHATARGPGAAAVSGRGCGSLDVKKQGLHVMCVEGGVCWGGGGE